MEKLIKEKISSLLSEEEEVLSVEQLGGMTNQNYLVKTTNKQYIVKFFGKGTEKLINRQNEKYNLELLEDLDLDVKNYLFDIESGIKVNEYIESAVTLDSTSIKSKFEKIAPILQTIHASGKELRGEFAPFEEIKKYESLIQGEISYPNYETVRKSVLSLKNELEKIGIEKKSCHIDLVPENFIEGPDGHLYLIDWEYAGLNYAANDIGCILCRYDWSDQQIERYLKAYIGRPMNQDERRFYYAFIPISAFYWFCWGLYKGSVGDDDSFFFLPSYRNLIRFIDKAMESYGIMGA